MTDSLAKRQKSLARTAKAEEIEEVTEAVLEATQQTRDATDALEMLDSAIDNFNEKKQLYDMWSHTVRKRIQGLLSDL